MSEPSLEEMAQAVEETRRRFADAEARVEELKPGWDAAQRELHGAYDARKVAVQLLEAAKRAHVVRRAADELGAGSLAPAYLVPAYKSVDPYYLVAVGPEGSGLYLHTPEHSHRYQGKVYARPRRDGDEAQKNYTGPGVKFVPNSDERLVEWETRGKDRWGHSGQGSSGAVKPLPPPEGGRWRWLKVREQEALTA